MLRDRLVSFFCEWLFLVFDLLSFVGGVVDFLKMSLCIRELNYFNYDI